MSNSSDFRTMKNAQKCSQPSFPTLSNKVVLNVFSLSRFCVQNSYDQLGHFRIILQQPNRSSSFRRFVSACVFPLEKLPFQRLRELPPVFVVNVCVKIGDHP